jgi:hypothetical protein
MNIFFPNVSGSSLAGEDFDFPKSFGADLTLAVVAFWDWQQPMVDSWIETAALLERQSPGFEYFEMPVIQESTPEIHRFIDDGMRSGITDRVAREKTVTLYLDKRDFMRSLGLPTDDEIYAILTGPSGLIMRMWTGSATPDARRQLEELVRTAEAVA